MVGRAFAPAKLQSESFQVDPVGADLKVRSTLARVSVTYNPRHPFEMPLVSGAHLGRMRSTSFWTMRRARPSRAFRTGGRRRSKRGCRGGGRMAVLTLALAFVIGKEIE